MTLPTITEVEGIGTWALVSEVEVESWHPFNDRGLITLYNNGLRRIVFDPQFEDELGPLLCKISQLNVLARHHQLEEVEVQEATPALRRAIEASSSSVAVNIRRREFLSLFTGHRPQLIAEHLPYGLQWNLSTCEACDECVAFCPRDAIAIKDLNQQKYYSFNAFECDGCEICVSECPQGSLELNSHFSHPAGLVAIAEKRCSLCRKPFHTNPLNSTSNSAHCKVCRKKQNIHYQTRIFE